MKDSTKTFGDIVKLGNRPSLDILNSLVEYDPLTGQITAKVNFGKRRMGAILGGRNTAGFVVSFPSKALNGEKAQVVLAHHLAYALTFGEWCKHSISHRDGDAYNNKWDNLIINKGLKLKGNKGPDIKIIQTPKKPDLLRCDRASLIDYIILMEKESVTPAQLEVKEATIQHLFEKNKELLQRNKNQIQVIQELNKNNIRQRAEIAEENEQLKKDFNKNSVILQQAYRLLSGVRCGGRYVDSNGFGEI